MATKIQAQRAVDLTVNHLRADILSGKYPPESKLPPERQLSSDLGINRLTLRAALSHLEAEGLLQPKHGQGVIVLDYQNSGSLELLAHIDDDALIEELLVLRRNFAAEAVALACDHASHRHINKLQSIANRQLDTDAGQNYLEGDIAFIKELVAASGSMTLILLFNTIERIMRAKPQIPIELLSDKTASQSSYRALIALIRYRNPDLARKAILGLMSPEDEQNLQKALAKP